MEKKYNIPLSQVFTRTSHIDQGVSKNALLVPCYKENIPYNGAPVAAVRLFINA